MLITLEGHLGSEFELEDDFEVMGMLDMLIDTGKNLTKVTTSVIKGSAHTLLEAGRGVKDGDVTRVLKSPFKGVGHAAGESYRGVRDEAEWFWRPSKASQWMQPAGAVLTSAGTVPSPLSPVLLGVGGALSLGGAVHSGLYAKDLQKKQSEQAKIRAKQVQERNKKWILIGGSALAVGATVLMLT